MFAEWELIGIPFRVTLGPKSIESGKVELYNRNSKKKEDYKLEEIVNIVLKNIN
jgi:prolyl-tRNA synthetase